MSGLPPPLPLASLGLLPTVLLQKPLTERQREVLARAALGHTTARIARALELAPRTVRAYLATACDRLDVQTRAEAVAWVWCYGLTSPEWR